MRVIKGLFVALGLLLSASFVSSQQAYLLVCRGGGELYFNYLPTSEFSPGPQILITFKKGPQAVGQNWEQRYSLEPGQAAWLDRRVADNEPERILLTDQQGFWISWTNGRIFGANPAFLLTLLDPNKFQSFYVVRDAKGNFLVTQVGPSM
jgi:hypothetical protein